MNKFDHLLVKLQSVEPSFTINDFATDKVSYHCIISGPVTRYENLRKGRLVRKLKRLAENENVIYHAHDWFGNALVIDFWVFND